MAREDDDRTMNPLTMGKGRTDEVDQSKGIFPPGVRHPPDAEIRSPGSLGGGSYEESGRGGVELGWEPSSAGAGSAQQGTGAMNEASAEQAPEPSEPKGALPPHEEEKKSR
ncbi:hypothetical protein [Polyangium spumosum]|uniref:Uncharacterized protein n=1 Tax=Polyangium spumosum TaxID=889282 RepID=A0A6N7Q9N1_9BACT|nr:hypothetical protein [Polyangium spumosum]MRG97591.1 hypothetical protein [Polyangium spumosum]